MKTVEFNSERELKQFENNNRKEITSINSVEFGEIYPMLEVSNKHASYYDAKTQSNLRLHAPFKVTIK